MHLTTRLWLGALAISALVPSQSIANETAVGVWKLVSEGRGGRQQESTVTITHDGEKLSGTIVGRPGEFDLTDVILDGATLKFKTEATIQGNPMALSFSGRISGDSLEGTWTAPFGEVSATGKRTSPGKSPSLVGTWILSVDSLLGVNERRLVINPDMTGTYGGGGFSLFKVRNVKVDGSQVTMDVTLETSGMELPSKISLTLERDNISGKLDYGQGEASIKGKRAATVVGTWKVTADSKSERILTVNADMTGTYGSSDLGEFKLSDVKVQDNTVTIKVTTESPSTIKLTVDGDKFTGELNDGQRTTKLVGVRE